MSSYFNDMRALATELGFMNRLTRRLWKRMGIDGEPSRFRGEPQREARTGTSKGLMPHVVTQSCCSDASCVYACPVNCIQPTPDSPDFLAAEMLYVDPSTCVDCGACVSACPVSAIKPHTKLAPDEQEFAAINAAYFAERPRERKWLATPPEPLTVRHSSSPLRVAVVGSGPAGMYAADELMTIPGARIDIYERLNRPYGLVRHGVAPDHRRTRDVTRQFEVILAQPGLELHTGVEVGRDITHDVLLTATTRSSTPSAPPRTAASMSPARTSPARPRRPSSSPGTTATRSSPTAIRPLEPADDRDRQRQRRARRRADHVA